MYNLYYKSLLVFEPLLWVLSLDYILQFVCANHAITLFEVVY